jgi:hypothetical protein
MLAALDLIASRNYRDTRDRFGPTPERGAKYNRPTRMLLDPRIL